MINNVIGYFPHKGLSLSVIFLLSTNQHAVAIQSLSNIIIEPSVNYSMTDFAAALVAKDKVLLGDAATFNKKMAQIRSAGADEIQCVFDFDATISKHKHNGEPAASCHTALEKTLGEEKFAEMVELRNKFIKIEFDTSMTAEEKSPHMTTWWSTAHKKIVEHNVQKSKIQESVKTSAIHIRENEAEFFKLLEVNGSPSLCK